MHVFNLINRIMETCQISCGDIEMAKRWLGQARIIFKLGNMSFYHTLTKSYKKNLICTIISILR